MMQAGEIRENLGRFGWEIEEDEEDLKNFINIGFEPSETVSSGKLRNLEPQTRNTWEGVQLMHVSPQAPQTWPYL